MNTTLRRPTWPMLGAVVTLAMTLAGCSQTPAADTSAQSAVATSLAVSSGDTYFTTDKVHTIDIDLDQADYEAMLATYAETGDKEWVTVTATIDGTTFEDVGLRLKGNSSLRTALASARGIELSEEDLAAEGSDSGDSSSDAAAPETIPWLIRLNKYVDGQNYLGRYDFVVRGNDTETSLNEAVAMAMLEEAGLATHRVAFTAFSVNGSEAKLRLVSEVPDDELWNEDWFGTDGATWKADSDGDWDYHGEDGAEYESIWKQRTGEDDMTPIVEFMDFINNSSDETFEDSLGHYLDLDQFAKYLAVEDLMNNWDTISGMGNNGYLHYDPSTGMMTLVAWDHDRAFESRGRGIGGPAGAGGAGGPGGAPGDLPEGFDEGDLPEGFPESLGQEGFPDGMELPDGFPEGMDGDFTPPDGFPEGMEPPNGTGQARPGRPGGGTRPDGMARPDRATRPGDETQSGNVADGNRPGGNAPGGAPGARGTNVLEARFRASEAFMKMYNQAYSELTASLIDSGFAQGVLDQYTELLVSQASELVSPQTVESDAKVISNQLVRDKEEAKTA